MLVAFIALGVLPLALAQPPPGGEIFVVGCGHSGTTIMLRLIGNLYGVRYTPDETCALCAVGRGIAPDEDPNDEFKRSAQRLAKIDAAAAAEGARRWVEKTPLHVRYLPKLFRLRPRAQVVVMVRDGRDVVSSFKGRRRPEFAHEAVSAGAQRWVDDTRAGLAYRVDPRVLIVRYEKLVCDPNATMALVMRFLGERFDPAKIFAPRKNTTFNGVTAAKVTAKPTNEARYHDLLRAYQASLGVFDGRGRWRKPPPRGLELHERALVHAVCGSLLAELGYTDSDKWVHEGLDGDGSDAARSDQHPRSQPPVLARRG